MLVIVQNPGMSSFAYTADDFANEPKKPESDYKIPALPIITHKGPEPSSSLVDHDGLQLRMRSPGDLTTSSIECGNRRDNVTVSVSSDHREAKEGTKCLDDKEDKNAMIFVNEVVVDVKGLKSYSFLPFESTCGDSRLLHPRSNANVAVQGFAPHPSSIVWFGLLRIFVLVRLSSLEANIAVDADKNFRYVH